MSQPAVRRACGESICERLNARFERLERKTSEDSGPLSKRAHFRKRFEERMDRLSRMASFQELSAFNRLPSARRFSPWSMGGWGLANDLVYLDWMSEVEEIEEEEAVPRRSGWTSKRAYVGAHTVDSPWFSTEHRPAAVSRGNYVRGTQSSARRAERKGDRFVPVSPENRQKQKAESAKVIPLSREINSPRRSTPMERANIRAAKVMAHLQQRRQVSQSLPPSIAKSTNRQLARLEQPERRRKPSGPIVRALQPIVQSDTVDTQLSPLALASQRQQRRGGKIRGLRPALSSSPMMQDLQVGFEQPVQESISLSLMDQSSIKPIQKEVPRAEKSNKKRALQRKETEAIPAQAKQEKSLISPMSTVVQRLGHSQQEPQDVQPVISRFSPKNLQRITKIWSKPSLDRLIVDRMVAQEPSNKDEKEETVVKSRLLNQEAATEVVEQHQPSPLRHAIKRQMLIEQIQNSVLPSVVPGQRIEQKIVSDLVQRIVAMEEEPDSDTFATLTEYVQAAQQRILSSRRMRQYAPEAIPLAPQAVSVDPDISETLDPQGRRVPSPARKSESPWFTRSTPLQRSKPATKPPWKPSQLTPLQRSKSTAKPPRKPSQLTAVQRASARKVEAQHHNPTRPKVISKQTGLSITEIKRVINEIQQGTLEREVIERRIQSSLHSRPSPLSYARPVHSVAVDPVNKPLQKASPFHSVAVDPVNKPLQKASPLAKFVQSNSAAEKENQEQSERMKRQMNSPLMEEVKSSSLVTEAFAERKRVFSQTPLRALWKRAATPQYGPEWRSMGTGGRSPGSSPRAWRLGTRPLPMSTPEAQLLSFDDPEITPEIDSVLQPSRDRKAAWFTRDVNTAMPSLSPADVSGFGRAKRTPFEWEKAAGKTAVWLQPNKTVMLAGGTVVHYKVAEQLGITPKKMSANQRRQLPLQWTLEGVHLQSNHASLPSWAKRASTEPQIKSSSDFLQALARASSTDDVVRVIFERADRALPQMKSLPTSATQVIEQIRKEAHEVESQRQSMVGKPREVALARLSSSGKPQRRRRSTVINNFTGLKPLSTAQTEERSADDSKVVKLAKRLEDLVLLAENNQREEAREGVRMAEDSSEAIAEGQAGGQPKEDKDVAVDIDALRQEVLMAFEQELSLRKIRSFDESNNQDIWW